MTSERPPRRTGSRVRALRPTDPDETPGAPDDIQDAYLKRAISELGVLNDEISAWAAHHSATTLPVLSSGAPQAEIAMIKWAPSLAERQEGVAFFGRAGSAILKSVQRLGVEPLALYGTLCVKLLEAGFQPQWLTRELQIVMPKLIMPMGDEALEAINSLAYPGSVPLENTPGVVQTWTPTIEAIVVPDIDESLDEQHAKRVFWAAFRSLGEWYLAQPPY
jgi:uracil-DNA glycosylase